MKLLGAIFSVVLMSSPAMAGFYLEPYLGYENGKIGDDKLTGTNLGGKIGMDTLGFAFGADVMMGSLSIKSDTTGDSSTWKSQDVGLFAQFTFPILVKVSGTYFLQSENKYEDATASGKGTKLGVGYTGLPFISINFDMIDISYDKLKTNAGSVDLTDADRKTWMLSVSLPLSL